MSGRTHGAERTAMRAGDRVVDGRARFAPVVTGAAFDGRVLVREGLQPGDEVVAEAAPVRAGMRIAPRAR